MKKKLIIMLIISLAAHITIAGTLIYIPSYLSNTHRDIDEGSVVWGIVNDKNIGTGEGGSGHGYRHGGSNNSKERTELSTGQLSTDGDGNCQADCLSYSQVDISDKNNEQLEINGTIEINRSGILPDNLFSVVSLNKESSQNVIKDDCNDIDVCTDGDAAGDNINIENTNDGIGGDDSIGNGIVILGGVGGNGRGGGYGGFKGYGNNAHGGSNGGDELRGFLDNVRNEIERNKYYPHIAKISELEGTVYVNFHIDQKGRPGSIVVGRSSGSKLLDESAVSTIKKIRHFKGTPKEIRELDITVPITYKLLEEKRD